MLCILNSSHVVVFPGGAGGVHYNCLERFRWQIIHCWKCCCLEMGKKYLRVMTLLGKRIWNNSLSASTTFMTAMSCNLMKSLYPATWHQHSYALKDNSLSSTVSSWLFQNNLPGFLRREGSPQAIQEGSEVTRLKGLCYFNSAVGQHSLLLLLFFQ